MPQAGGLDARASYLRLLQVAGDAGLSDEALDLELDRIVESLPPDDTGYGPVVDFAAELLRSVHAGTTDDPGLEEALSAIPSKARQSHTIWEIADARATAGHAADAEALARFGLESPEPTEEPRLWHVRAEAARLDGRWDRAEEYLDRMEVKIPPDATYASRVSAADKAADKNEQRLAAKLLAQNHEYRSRLLQERAHLWIEFGLLDLAKGPTLEAIAEAEKSVAFGDFSALAAARLLACERALASSDGEDESAALAREGAADERLAPWRHLFRFAEGTAEIERARTAVFAHGDPGQAATRARAALAAALAAKPAPVVQLKAELGLGELERLLGRIDEARGHLARASELGRTMGPGGGPADLAVRTTVLAWRLAYEGGAEPAALGAARHELFDAYRRFLDQWKSTPLRSGGIGFLHLARRAQLVSEVIEAELSAAPAEDAEARAFARLLEAQAMGTRAREDGHGPIGIDELRTALLPAGQGLIVLLPARDRSHLFLVDGKGVAHREVAVGRDELRRQAREVTKWLQDPAGALDDRVQRALSALDAALLPADVRTRMRSWSGVTSVGFELLCGLPFGVLGAEKGEPLARRFALSSLPSAAYGIELAQRAPAPAVESPDIALVVGDEAPKDLRLAPFRLVPFQFEERERQRLLAPFGDRACLFLENKEASRERLLTPNGPLSGARILHFFAHGVSLPGHENSSVLVLTQDGEDSSPFLTTEDVRALAPAGLVILSACSAGYGPARTGDDCLVHLGGAFLDAGARCVLLTRFPVEYEATLALMERVHARLAAGDAPAEALRAALAGAGGAGGLAAYHATPFEVLGLGFEPVLRARDSKR